MTTELLSQIWRTSQLSVLGPISKLTTDNYRNRLLPETASAGFIALHTAEAMHRFARMMSGREITIMFEATGGAADEGKPLDLNRIQQMLGESFDMIADQISRTSDEQWAEVITTSFGEVPRMQILTFLMHHNSYHAGQIAQAIKKGKPYDLVTAN